MGNSHVTNGPSKIVNIFPYKLNNYNFLTPLPVLTNINIFKDLAIFACEIKFKSVLNFLIFT